MISSRINQINYTNKFYTQFDHLSFRGFSRATCSKIADALEELVL